MQPLEKMLRKQLENTIKAARDIAEAAAKAALEQVGVGEAIAFAHLSETERELRRKLRVHGRQLGDVRNAQTEMQEIDRLAEEVAYEHWHRMLFARFLAENNLLMYWPEGDDEPIDVNLETCQSLLDEGEEKAGSVWELVARFAARMLPQIFRPDSPVFQIVLPPEHQQKLERLVTDLPLETFTASDSLGWVYQFWQANNKDRINKSEVKIGARELPAVTQLFTEPYMVSFLLDNSLGAWWAARRLSEADLNNTTSEGELRSKAAILGVPLEYLRFVQQDDGSWTPAAGIFERWPEHLSALKTLDPCCGSGHFLVAAFLMLVPMRMELEGLTARKAVDRVLTENIHGLELDQRCVELAAFALALTAWRYPNAGGYRALPELHIACSGLSVSVAKEEWKQLGLGKKNLTIALDWLHDTFKNAPVLGSLLNPAKTQAAKIVQWDELSQTLAQALAQEQTDEQHEIGVVAQGLSKAATLLAGQYQWVITNVPYLARGKQDERLRDFCEKYYSAGKNDLATVFLARCLELCVEGGTASIVLPQNWLFLTTYKKFREKLLRNDSWNLLAQLGAQAFQTPMWDFNVQLITITRGNAGNVDLLNQASSAHIMRGLDVSEPRLAGEKAAGLLIAKINSVLQADQLENPSYKIVIDTFESKSRLSDYADTYKGICSGDTERFCFAFWEIPSYSNEIWQFHRGSFPSSQSYIGMEGIFRWDEGSGSFWEFVSERLGENGTSAWIRGTEAWGSTGLVIKIMGDLPVSLYTGTSFDNNVSVIIPKNKDHLDAIWSYCSSPEYNVNVRKVNSKLSITDKSFLQVPFELSYWTRFFEEKYPNGLPKPYSNAPTQWIFHGYPAQSDEPLQVAVARLLGYRWPAELDTEMELSGEARSWVKQSETLLSQVDDDGIVCIPPVRGEASASDRLFNLLVAAYGDNWSNDTLAQLLKQANHSDKSLETWLREKFFTQHCKLFQHRPFIWHIWDGLPDGFAALVNYHKLDAKLLETLIYTYLGDWISRQKQDINNGVDSAQEKLAAAEALKKKLELILAGEAPYDIFVRWKSLDKQPIGWNPDLNDGVRLNIRPFLSVPDVSKRGAGVLRDKPNIKWEKDRGKDVESAPWYHLFNGDRINDHHLKLEEKRIAQSNLGEV
jgi:hypothetical protein